MKHLLFFFAMIFAFTASADLVPTEKPFRATEWSPGFHLLSGIGLNTSTYSSRRQHVEFGLGSNFKADVGYFINERWAVEIGSDVKFNRVDANLIWDTLFTFGFRYRFQSPVFHDDASFVRVFFGRAPTVIFLENIPPALRATGASRIQFDGPVVGLGGGRFYETERGFVWFIEWDLAYQWLRQQDVIRDQADVPIVVTSGAVNDESKIFSVFLNIGCVVF